MRITSCDCFEEVGAEVEPTSIDTFNMVFTEYINLSDGSTVGFYRNTLEDIKFCPFCGKKIEVEE